MKKFLLKLCIFSVSVLLISAGFMAAAATKIECSPKAIEDEENAWWVGTNLTVTPTSGSGFEMESEDGTAMGANIAWGVSMAQIKANPYFTIKILNTGRKDEGAYMKMFFQAGGKQIPHPDFKDPNLENWVIANAKNGVHSFNLLEALGDKLPSDDAQIIFTLYVDPSGTEETLKIGELYFSSEKATVPVSSVAASSVQSSAPTVSSDVPASSVVSSETALSSAEQTQPSSTAISSKVQSKEVGGKKSSVGLVIGIVLAALVAGGAAAYFVIFRKKKSEA